VDELEQKWRACLDMSLETGGDFTNASFEDIATEHDVGCGRTLRRHMNRALEGESLVRQPGSGRPSLVSPETLDFLNHFLAEQDYEATIREISDVMFEEFGIWCV